MPIAINLLAEAQAAEELRRRDPVKRTLFGAGTAVALILIWALTVQTQIMRANSELKAQNGGWTAIDKNHAEVTGHLKKAADIESKLAALTRLSTNRFLMGSTLNWLQQTVVDQVQAIRVKTDQSFTLVAPVAAKTNSSKTIPAKPASALEKVAITVEAKDWNPAEQNYNKLKEALSNAERRRGNSEFPRSAFPVASSQFPVPRLTRLSNPSFDPADPATPFVLFTLEMQFQEVLRYE